MSRLTELIAQIKSKDSQLGVDLEREFKALSSRREFGLNFERHRPEIVELPNRVVRKGDKVRILPKRGSTKKGDQELWLVKKIKQNEKQSIAILESTDKKEVETIETNIDDLIVIAEFQDYIYPGLVSTGKVENGDDKPYQTVINGENYHALKALTFTHKGKIDAIYIDPPYNTGAKDWKYNNNYVESDDSYRHSKWLAFMERRLLVAKKLLNPDNSVIILTIDEKEYLRIGLLLEQTFPEANIQMVSTIIKPEGTNRTGEFSRTNEFIFFVMFGGAHVQQTPDDMSGRDKPKDQKKIEWRNLRRRENTSVRSARPNQFYAIYVSKKNGTIHSIGNPLPLSFSYKEVEVPEGCFACFPFKPDGTEMLWGVTPDSLRNLLKNGFVRTRYHEKGQKGTTIQYLTTGTVKAIQSGQVSVIGKDDQGAIIGSFQNIKLMPKTTWSLDSHNAQTSGTLLLKALLKGRLFPFPKSLYAVEDALRFFILDNPSSILLDFFAGSGTTSHAVMRLNKQDNGSRQCISVTNNEVSANEQKKLAEKGLRPGDDDWEKWGICDYITKPRIKAAITGKTPEGESIKGDYKFTDVFPMSEGFKENAEFFTLTYETPISISYNLAFEHIAPLLWMRAGSKGKQIDSIPESGWAVADNYGILFDLDKSSEFYNAIDTQSNLKIAYLVTDDDRRFQSIAKRLPKGVKPVRLYESYLKNFQFTNDI